jgi:hypothetical protein
MNAPSLRSPRVRPAVWVALSLALLVAGCEQKWYAAKDPELDAEVDKAFFAGLDFKAIPNVPEPKSLRPCCILGNDVHAEVGSIPVPGYEISYTLDIDTLGTHQFNKGFITFEPRGGKRLLSDEVSGILYTCRGGFIDIAHVRDNADRTVFFASQIEQLAATGGTIALTGDGAGARHRIVLKPLDKKLVHAHGVREVVVSLAEWLNYQAGIWHEITTWYGWASTPFSERPSAFSPEDLYSNFLGMKIAGTIFRRHAATSELEYERAVTSALKHALVKLGPVPQEASRRAFEYVDGIWWDSSKRVPENLIVRHRNFHTGPTLTPWKLADAAPSEVVTEFHKEFDKYCGGDWKPLILNVPDRLGDVPFRQMATIEFEPEEVLVKNGFPFPRKGDPIVTQDDFPSILAATEREADKVLGPGAGKPAARPGEKSRYRAGS